MGCKAARRFYRRSTMNGIICAVVYTIYFARGQRLAAAVRMRSAFEWFASVFMTLVISGSKKLRTRQKSAHLCCIDVISLFSSL